MIFQLSLLLFIGMEFIKLIITGWMVQRMQVNVQFKHIKIIHMYLEQKCLVHFGIIRITVFKDSTVSLVVSLFTIKDRFELRVFGFSPKLVTMSLTNIDVGFFTWLICYFELVNRRTESWK